MQNLKLLRGVVAACLFLTAPSVHGETLPSVRKGPSRLVPGDHGVGQRIDDVVLKDQSGKSIRLSDYSASKALVVAFTNTSCPICKKYTPTLAAIEASFAEQGVAFLFVNPTPTDKEADIADVIARLGLKGPYVRDAEFTLASALRATHTTDVFVLDSQRTLLYRGAVDDQYGFGYSIEKPRRHYLRDALEAVCHDQPVLVAATEAPGCPLDVPKSDSKLAAAESSGHLTYHNQIARVLQKHCQSCHREGGVAPFALEDYESVVAQSGAIRRVIEDEIMPPWFSARRSDGQASPFINDCSLSQTDKSLVLEWLNGDKLKGDEADHPLPKQYPSEWQIGTPDLVIALPKPIKVNATGIMPYQNVVVETGFTEDRYVSALEVMPSAREVVHHCLVFVLPPENAGHDVDNERDGFFAAYAPGYDALKFNPGFGKVIPAGSRLKFQMHYTPNGTATEDQTQLGLVFAKERPERLVNVAGIAQPRLAIPPHASNHEVTATTTLPQDSTVLAFFPHMHLRGKAFRYEITTPDGVTETLLDIPRYDFNWQLSYRFAEPLELPKGTVIKATAWYDNSSNNPANPDPNKTVRWGQQTDDEMMIGYIEYHSKGDKIDPLQSSPLAALARTLRGKEELESKFKQLDRNGDERLSTEELPSANRSALMRLDSDQDGFISRNEAAVLVKLINRLRRGAQ